jgi:hypothetical protein
LLFGRGLLKNIEDYKMTLNELIRQLLNCNSVINDETQDREYTVPRVLLKEVIEQLVRLENLEK